MIISTKKGTPNVELEKIVDKFEKQGLDVTPVSYTHLFPMDALDKARAEIDAVDAQLAALFERRMAAVLAVAEYKKAHGLSIMFWTWSR